MLLLWCACPFRLMLPGGYFPEHALRKDELTITAIDDRYSIAIHSGGRMLLPISPEGPFPKWSASTRLIAEGSGETVTRDGVTYKKYTFYNGLRSETDYFFDGSIWFSEEDRTLIVDVEYKEEYRHLLNHSGTYRNITVNRPTIIVLTKDTPIERIDGRHVRARGTFAESGNYFQAAGKTFYTYCSYRSDKLVAYEVIGIVHSPDPNAYNPIAKKLPCLGIITWKAMKNGNRVQEKSEKLHKTPYN